ncbi:MAG: type I polyketide synthase, partial [bacterium]
FVRRWQEIAFGSETDKDTQDDAGKGTQDDTDKANQDQIPALLREHGVYVITGGLGGLGLIFARYLARQVRAKLVLAGRSDLGTRGQDKITGLESLGAEVVYVQADIASKEQAQELIAKARQRFGRIHGVIHSAGVVRDALLSKKTPEDMEQVLAPKVYGTLYLDDATRDEQLDFFVLFSSLAAAIGNVGQADYAYANSFMDNFAAWREGLRARHERSGKSISINWPLWQEGGMRMDEQTKILFSRTMGLKALETEDGLSAFARCMALEESQVLVIEGEKGKIRRALGMAAGSGNEFAGPSMPEAQAGKARAEKARVEGESLRVDQGLRPDEQEFRPDEQGIRIDEQELCQRIQKDLLKAVSETLKIREKDLDPDEDLSGYGFDSLSFTEFANRINEKYGLELTPAIFFEYPSIGSFAQYLSREQRDRLISFYQDSVKMTRQPALKASGQPVVDEPVEEAFEDTFEEIRLKSRFLQSLSPERSQADGANQYSSASSEPIAIIGMAGMMPQSEDLDIFWKHLEEGKDLITEIPPDRWDWRTYFGDPAREENKTTIKWGGFMKEVDKFDAAFFGISPREAELMDPQQRIFLQTVWKTIEDAGYKPSDLSGTRTGLFVGVASSDYQDILRSQGISIEAYVSTGMSHSILANRISFLLNLHGPSEPIDTACSSSLVAIHRAVETIRTGGCEMAIAGGVNVILSPALYISFSKAGMLCEDGRCKTFDKRANGYVRGEGAGAILLKPLSRALADNDHIYALIRATAENHGGHATSLTAPNPNAQAQLLVSAYEKAQIDPATVSYIETHGTGTSLGDPIEINGLKKAFEELY